MESLNIGLVRSAQERGSGFTDTVLFCTQLSLQLRYLKPWVGVKNFGFTEKQKNIEQGSTKLKELHVCIMRVQKKMVAWRSEAP